MVRLEVQLELAFLLLMICEILVCRELLQRLETHQAARS